MMPVDIDKDTQKEAIKEAITEWLDVQFAAVGRFTVKGILAAALAGLAYAYLVTHGWKV